MMLCFIILLFINNFYSFLVALHEHGRIKKKNDCGQEGGNVHIEGIFLEIYIPYKD